MWSYFKMIGQILRRSDLIIYYLKEKHKNKVRPKNVLFLSHSRSDLSGNFYYISEAIKDDYEIRYILQGMPVSNHYKARLMAQAHYILVDDFYPDIYPVPLRKETRFIQVWHALGAFKTVGFARKKNHDEYSLTHHGYTDAIVSSPYIIDDYAKAFHMDPQRIHPLGIPRTDIFFDPVHIHKTRVKFYQKYPMLKDKKVILFAPTFRGNNIHNAYYDYDKIDFKRMEETLGEDYVCIIKMHPFIKKRPMIDPDSSFYLDLSDEREINDLLFITDILITDYSSVIFEASLVNIHVIFYAYDLDDYIEQRDFFYPYNEYTYGPVVQNEDELYQAILHPSIDEAKLARFRKKFLSSCDGHATERFVKTLLK